MKLRDLFNPESLKASKNHTVFLVDNSLTDEEREWLERTGRYDQALMDCMDSFRAAENRGDEFAADHLHKARAVLQHLIDMNAKTRSHG